MQDYKSEYGVTENGAYLMNASIGGVHRETRDEIKKWTDLTYETGAINDMSFFELLEASRSVAGEFLGLSKDEVAFSGSSSLNMNHFATLLKNTGITKVVAPSVEFPTSVVPWFHHEFEVVLVEPRDGRINEEGLLSHCTGENTVVVCSGVQFLTGQRMNLKRLSDEIEKRGGHLIINGTQHVGQFDLDLGKLKYLAFTASLHKWLGADLGVSFISVNKTIRSKFKTPIAGWAGVEEPWRLANEVPKILHDMGSYQIGTVPFGLIAGAAKAMEVQMKIGKAVIEKRVLELSAKLSQVISTRGFELISPRDDENECSGICTFRYEGDLEEALAKLEKEKVYLNGRRGSIRASIHFYNDEKDLEALSEALKLI